MPDEHERRECSVSNRPLSIKAVQKSPLNLPSLKQAISMVSTIVFAVLENT